VKIAYNPLPYSENYNLKETFEYFFTKLTAMQIIFWMPAVLTILLVTLLWHVYRENREYRRRNMETHQEPQSVQYRLGQINPGQQNEATKRKETEEKLRGYLNLLDTLINTIPNPIYFKDDQGIYRGCNKAFAKHILGISRAEIIGQRSQDLTGQIPSELADIYQLNERNMLLEGGVQSFEAEVPCGSCTRREFLFSIAPVKNDDGHSIGSVGVMLDLTEKNRAARDRFQKEKLQGVLETAGAVCHEMNQPLQAILGHTELSLADISPDNPAYLSLTKISKQIDRMAAITHKLQSITHYETMDYDSKTKIIDIHKASSL
jgi:PAS domain S-box-containing protein